MACGTVLRRGRRGLVATLAATGVLAATPASSSARVSLGSPFVAESAGVATFTITWRSP
jgi:hypothetical protein